MASDRDKRAGKRVTTEPLEPGGELGETREVPAGGSANDEPGRPPRTKVVIHPDEPRENAQD